MKLRYKLLAGILLAIGLYQYVHWDEKHVTHTVPRTTGITLRATSSHITATTDSDRLIVPNYGHGIIVIQDKTTLSYKPVIKGFTLTPGFSTDFQRVGLGLEVGFYKRLGLLCGSNFYNLQHSQWDVRFYVGLAYRLPFDKFDNLSVYTGIDSGKALTGGVFIRFGSN